jgi:hypothetical protein
MPKQPARRARRPAFNAEDRIGTSDFLKITRLGKTTFFKRYRSDPYWETRFDIRVDPLTGFLHMSRTAAESFALERRGEPGRSQRADRLGEHSIAHGIEQQVSVPAASETGYGAQLAALTQALAAGTISREQFDRAVIDLDETS